MKKNISVLCGSFLIFISQLCAQMSCGSEVYELYLKAKDPQYDQRMEQKKSEIQEYLNNNPLPVPHSVVTIPVVFHIVWQTSSQNLPDACLADQIASLNRDFRKLNSDITKAPSQFQSIAADVEFEFCLASKDPQGNPTSGIERKQTTSTFGVNDNIKFTSSGGMPIWDCKKYLNIWVGEIGSVGGFSPKGCSSSSTDGVVIHWAEVGNCDKITNGDQGRTVVHEVGHWMGLSHTFQGGCSGMTSSDCASGGDLVCDTPPVAQQSFSSNCSSQPNTCSESPNQIDMIWNHMDYTHPACKVLFTNGQKALMYASTSSCRSTIYNGTAASQVCSGTTGIASNSTPSQVLIFPNPFSEQTTIDLSMLKRSAGDVVSFSVCNVLGTEVACVQNMTENKVQLRRTFAPGVYFFRILLNGNCMASGKLIATK